MTEALFLMHLPPGLNGGWIDRLDQNGVPAVDDMPASTLYHIAGAAMDIAAMVEQPHG